MCVSDILLIPSVLLSLRPCLACLCAFSFFLYRGLFVITSRLDFSKKAVSLNLALKRFNGFFYIVADYSDLYDNLSPASSITCSPSLSVTAPASAETSPFTWLLGSCFIDDQRAFQKRSAV